MVVQYWFSLPRDFVLENSQVWWYLGTLCSRTLKPGDTSGLGAREQSSLMISRDLVLENSQALCVVRHSTYYQCVLFRSSLLKSSSYVFSRSPYRLFWRFNTVVMTTRLLQCVVFLIFQTIVLKGVLPDLVSVFFSTDNKGVKGVFQICFILFVQKSFWTSHLIPT